MAFVPTQLFSYFMAGEAGLRTVVIAGVQGVLDSGGTIEAADFGLTQFYSISQSHNETAARECQIDLNAMRTIATVTTTAGDQIEFEAVGPDTGTGTGV